MDLLIYLKEQKGYLEVLYLVSAPLMLLGVIVAWLQLILLRRDLRAKYKRDSIKEVFKSLKGFALLTNLSLSLENSLDDEGLWKKAPPIKGLDASCFPVGCGWFIRYTNSASANIAIDFFNELEMLSQKILSGIADEHYAYKIQGSFFIGLVEKHRAELAALRQTNEDDGYGSIVELYTMWKHRQIREIEFKKVKAQIKKILQMPKGKRTKIIN